MVKNRLSSGGDSPTRILLVGGCGYIGSYLYTRLIDFGFKVDVVDQLRRGNPLGLEIIEDDYANLPISYLEQFDVVLWFAGHSSVSQSVNDPNGALTNNCLNLYAFASKLRQKTKFIYASSGSLYSTNSHPILPATESSLVNIPSQNAYDISKFAFDYLAKTFLTNYYGLRMGTLCGYSPNLRPELVFNAMNISAVTTGCVNLKNSESFRTILFLDDLWELVLKIILTPQQSGFYNAGSVSFKMGELAHLVAKKWGAQVLYQGETDTYSFLLDTTRMKAICGNAIQTPNLSSICEDFIRRFLETRT